MTQSWKLVLPCTRAEAEALAGDVPELALLDEPPVLMTSEPDETRPDEWRLDAYFASEPDAATIALIAGLVASARGTGAVVEPVIEQDWVTLSQAGLEPITAGRFFVHTAAHARDLRPGRIWLRIEAGRAFGTGQHATTAVCLTVIDGLAASGRTFANALDLGTGTGLLALAMRKCWPEARVIASDIDPVSIEVAAENIGVNGERAGEAAGEIALAAADGMAHAALAARAPYDLIAANILAGPLIDMAADISAALAKGGTLLLAGLLTGQADAVAAAYSAHGCRVTARHDAGDWPALVLERS